MNTNRNERIVLCITAVILTSVLWSSELWSSDESLFDTVRKNNMALRSGEVLFLSVNTHKARPMPKTPIRSFQELREHGRATEPQLVTYSLYAKTSFKDGKYRVDVDMEATDFFPTPVHRTYIYDGERTTSIDHVSESVAPRQPVSFYRMTENGTFYLPPNALGYDVNGIVYLSALMQNEFGERPELHQTTVGNTTTITGSYPSTEKVTLAVIEYDPDQPDLFKRCVYNNPKWFLGGLVEIVVDEVRDFNGVPYPTTAVVRQISAPSIERMEEGKVTSEQVLTVLEASFNDETVTDDLFSTDVPEGYSFFDGNRAKRRAEFQAQQP